MIKFATIILAIITISFSGTLADVDGASFEGMTCTDIYFGYIPSDSINEKFCYLINEGTRDIKIFEIKIKGTDSSFFKLSGNLLFPFDVHSYEAKPIPIVFNPTSNKSYQAFGEVYSSINFPCIFQLRGNGLTDILQNSINNNSISPNPAADFIEINVPTLESGSESVVIFDILGVEVLQGIDSRLRGNDNAQSGEKVRIDVSGLTTGVYFVRAGSSVQRFIKY